MNKGPKNIVAPPDNEDNLSLTQIKRKKKKKKKKSPPIHFEEEAFVNAIIDKVVSTMLGGVLQVESDYATNDDRNAFQRAHVPVFSTIVIPLSTLHYVATKERSIASPFFSCSTYKNSCARNTFCNPPSSTRVIKCGCR